MMHPVELASVREILGYRYNHTYTRTPVARGAQDADAGNQQLFTEGVPSSGNRCLFVDEDELVESGDTGTRILTSRPMISVPSADPLKVNDLVSDVLDQQGATLMAGPLRVESINPVAEFGESVEKVAILYRGDPQ